MSWRADKSEERGGGHSARSVALTAAIAALGVAACGPAPLSSSTYYTPPPPVALVAIVDPTPDQMANEMRQLEDVIRASAMPNESVVVMYLQPSFGQTYVVRPNDSLSSIAIAHSVALADLEAANPQLGPVAGRNWKLIHPGERVTLPDGAAQGALALVSKAPAGPPPPILVRLPKQPANPTDFQRAEYERTVASDNATNAARIAAWRAGAAASVQGWQQKVVANLEAKLGTYTQPAVQQAPNPPMLSASLNAGLTTLHGLPGRHWLLLLGGGDIGPGGLVARSLLDVNLVVANVNDSKAAADWTSAGGQAGAASVSALDPALTQLQLAQLLSQQPQGGT